jgi:hypothetical protein
MSAQIDPHLWLPEPQLAFTRTGRPIGISTRCAVFSASARIPAA